MTKKTLIPTLIMLASSITVPLINIPSVQAEKLAINGTDYWTMDEVMIENEKYEKNKSICNGNMECEGYLETAYLLAGGKYSAAASFSDYYFMITAINPTKSSISVRFDDTAASRWSQDNKTDVFKNLYLFWWEDGVPEYNLKIFTNPNPNRHEIFTYLANPGEKWLPANQEYEIILNDMDFNILKTTPIYFAAQSELSDALSGRHFEDCLILVEGKENYECRAAFDELGNIAYQPYEIKTEPTPEIISTSSIKVSMGTSSTSNITTPATEVVSTSTMGVPEATPEITEEKTGVTSQDPKQQIEVPLAAGNTEEEHIFPWWIIIFGFSGIFLMFWWLVPVKKVQKKY